MMGHKSEPGKILNNTYLIDGNMVGIPQILALYVVEGDKTALIDSGTSQSAGKVIDALKGLGFFPVDYIIITHEHADHIQGAAPLVKAMGGKVKVFAGKLAKPMIEDPSKIGYDFGMGPIEPVKNVTPLEEGDVVDLGGVELEVIAVPGHAPGHIALYDKANKNIFLGDSIGNKVDVTTFIPSHNPPWFNKEQYYETLDKLKKVSFDTACLGHYGCWEGPDAKNLLDDAKQVFENFWGFFDANRDKLDDIAYLTKSLVEKYMSESKTVDRVGEAFATVVITWLRDGFKHYHHID
jgi:glyoxylase-like metal-dependent hydrolase (beta-lactamase superfamily II)